MSWTIALFSLFEAVEGGLSRLGQAATDHAFAMLVLFLTPRLDNKAARCTSSAHHRPEFDQSASRLDWNC
jgi:hypothetical protein